MVNEEQPDRSVIERPTFRKPLAEVIRGLEVRAATPEPEGACEVCGGREWVVVADGRNGTAAPCRCVTGRSIEERLRRMGVPLDLAGARWEDFHEPTGRPRPDLDSFPEPDSCVTFLGSTGTSKTFAAVSVLREWVLAGRRCCFLHGDELARQARECFANEEQPEALVDRLLRYDLRVLDEAWGDRRTEFSDDVTSSLVRRCLRTGAPIVLTTNQDEAALTAIEPKVASRVTGRGALCFDFSARPDFRRAEWWGV